MTLSVASLPVNSGTQRHSQCEKYGAYEDDEGYWHACEASEQNDDTEEYYPEFQNELEEEYQEDSPDAVDNEENEQ